MAGSQLMWLPDALVAHLNTIQPLSSEVWQLMRPLFSRKTLARREHFAWRGSGNAR